MVQGSDVRIFGAVLAREDDPEVQGLTARVKKSRSAARIRTELLGCSLSLRVDVDIGMSIFNSF